MPQIFIKYIPSHKNFEMIIFLWEHSKFENSHSKQIFMETHQCVSSAMMQRQSRAPEAESTLEDFFKEPKLGTSWYNPSGPTPTFDMEQKIDKWVFS